jgi:hypothetical protein
MERLDASHGVFAEVTQPVNIDDRFFQPCDPFAPCLVNVDEALVAVAQPH